VSADIERGRGRDGGEAEGGRAECAGGLWLGVGRGGEWGYKR